jgi:6-phosphofructokinase 2
MTVATITLNPSIDKTFSVQRVVPDRKLTAENLREYPGGGGINVARASARLGGACRALWSCGGDTGRRLARLLDAEEVPHDPVPIAGRVRENLIVEDASSGQQYRFGMPGPLLSEDERSRWAERIGHLPSFASYAVFSGSLPGSTPPDWYEQLLRSLPSAVRIIVDAKREALHRALAVGVFLVKPNVHELEEISGREMTDDAEIERTSRAIVDGGGAKAVVVSLGRAGALLVTAEVCERVTAPMVPLRSAVGAGDSMVGGLVTALDQGGSLREAVRLGVAAGAAAVMTPGTDLCRRDDVLRLYQSMGQVES